jgi:hypothetical protein
MEYQAFDIECPKCGLISPSSSKQCDCGWEFVERPPVFRSGDSAVVEDGGTLPPRCVKCNAPAGGAPIRYTFVDSALGGEPQGVITSIIHLWTRRTGQAYVSLCARHRRRRWMIRWGGVFVLGCGAVLAVYATIASKTPPPRWIEGATALGITGFTLVGIDHRRDVRARIYGRLICIRGASAAFLDSLPDEGAVRQSGDDGADE